VNQPTKLGKLLKILTPIAMGGAVGATSGNWRVPGSGGQAADAYFGQQREMAMRQQALQNQTAQQQELNQYRAAEGRRADQAATLDEQRTKNMQESLDAGKWTNIVTKNGIERANLATGEHHPLVDEHGVPLEPASASKPDATQIVQGGDGNMYDVDKRSNTASPVTIRAAASSARPDTSAVIQSPDQLDTNEGEPALSAIPDTLDQQGTPNVLRAPQKQKDEGTDIGKLPAEIEAQIGQPPNPKAYTQGLNDPKYKSDLAAWGKKAMALKNAETASSGESRAAAYGRNRPVQVLDTWNGNRPVTVSAADAEDNPDRYVTQSGGEKSLPKEALLNDIRTSAENVRSNLDVLNRSGFDRAKLAASLADPDSTSKEFLQSIPRGQLDDKAQQFVTDLFNLREQAMAMRSVLGAGAGSEDMRRAILSTLPGVATPSSSFGEKQVNNLLAVLNRLERGIPNVPLRDQAGTGANQQPVPTHRYDPATGKIVPVTGGAQ